MMFDDFHDFFRYDFGHWFWMSLGIDCGTILVSLCNENQCFGVTCVLIILRFGVLFIFDQIAPKYVACVFPFSILFRDLCPHTSTPNISNVPRLDFGATFAKLGSLLPSFWLQLLPF